MIAKNLIKYEHLQVTRKGPRVKSNLLFNRRKPGVGISSGRNKFAGKIGGILSTPAATTTTTESSTDREEDNVQTTTVATSLEPEEEEGERREKRPNISSRFKSSNRRPFGGVRPGKHIYVLLKFSVLATLVALHFSPVTQSLAGS